MNECMNERMNEWVNEWMDGWMNEWINESMNFANLILQKCPHPLSLLRFWSVNRTLATASFICQEFFPESVWAKGSSNSGGLSNIFTSPHLHITSWNLHIFPCSHPHIFTSSHLHICWSSHLVIFTSVHLHIFSSSHPHIFTSSHLHILTSSHILIFTSAHLLIFSSSHLHILSCPLALSFSSISLLIRRGAVPTRRHETQPFSTKRCSIAKNWSKIAICKTSGKPFRTKWSSIA